MSNYHYEWCTGHVDDEGFDFCESREREVGGVRVTLSAGGRDDVPAIEVYGQDEWLSADEARQLARTLMEVADELEASPLPNVKHTDA